MARAISPTQRRYSTSSTRAASRSLAVSTGTRFVDTVSLDFHEPAGVDQTLHLHERARGLHGGKDIAVRACRFFPYTSPGAATEPSGAIGAVPETATMDPTRTAREKPMRGSNGDPEETSFRTGRVSRSGACRAAPSRRS